jgi:hypothetical protein
MSLRASTAVSCPFCSTPAPHVYSLPTRVANRLPRVRPACYFCYIRMTGIKPTRSRIVADGELVDGSSST